MPPPNLQHLSDTGLWLIVIEGNVSAYSELYERYWESLFETAHRHLYDKAARCSTKKAGPSSIQPMHCSMAVVRDLPSEQAQLAELKS